MVVEEVTEILSWNVFHHQTTFVGQICIDFGNVGVAGGVQCYKQTCFAFKALEYLVLFFYTPGWLNHKVLDNTWPVKLGIGCEVCGAKTTASKNMLYPVARRTTDTVACYKTVAYRSHGTLAF